MAKFKIVLREDRLAEVEVEAADIEAAKDKAAEIYTTEPLNWSDWEVAGIKDEDVEEIQ